MNHVRRATAHSLLALLEGLLIASMLVVLVAGTTLAARGGGGKKGNTVSGGSFTVAMVIDANGNGSANWADTITYDVSKVTVANPYITTNCVQNGTTVLTTWAGWYSGYLWPAARNIKLSSDAWTGGAATCTAVLSGTATTLTYAVGG
ncbi:MAG TPA: hypothetical protein VGK16_10080 [Candidatus Limnocylindrales bacterium]|jgi:hypothetical protein